ncbi:serine/threonine-protein kinase [Vibrio coralliirubri]|uniref:serine/threonine-protein kinase n=1 Tax=Vibrio coralliirubri TaxID=1516159 RepID=UPI00065E0446|nr:serine/threonine-protein kinase [Vibrio coralliirubri]
MNTDLGSTKIFYQMIDMDPKNWRSMLSELNQGFPEIAQRVSDLLVAHEQQCLSELLDVHLSSSTLTIQSFENDLVDGRYLIGHELGKGGFGVVYFASRCDHLFEHNYAVKFFNAEAFDILGEETLFTEAQIMANLSHSNITKVYDAGLHKGFAYIVMEYVDGCLLDEYLSNTPLSFDQKLILFRDICSAIEYAHELKVLHADLKPENVLINSHGIPKIIDFNLTQTLRCSSEPLGNSIRAVSRTYASPEQIVSGSLDERSDVFSLGRILQEMFPSDTAPRDLVRVYLYATNLNRTHRYQSVRDLANDIENVRCCYPLNYRNQHCVYRTTKFIQRYPASTVYASFFIAILTTALIALSIEAKNLSRQKLQLDSIIYDATSMVYPLNNSLLDWDEIIRSRNNIVVDVDVYSEGINSEVNEELLNETLYDSWIATDDIEPIGSLVVTYPPIV